MNAFVDVLPKKKRCKIREDSSNIVGKSNASLRDHSLPIWSHRDKIAASVRDYKTTIVAGETGSGKSTQLPQFLADLVFSGNSKCVVCTQPRRVAAITIAEKVAAERGGIVGHEVGYSIRFEDKTSDKTRIKFVTDGVLLRECMSDGELDRYSVVILDEAHERSLQTDILMGLLLNLQERRPDFRIVIMSATLQIDLFSGYFNDSNVVIIPGRQYPVDKFYVPEPETDFVDAAMITCLQIHAEEEVGGVLVFLPGQDDIESLQILLEDRLGWISPKYLKTVPVAGLLKTFSIHPLYAALSPDEQLKAFAPSAPGVRKFVLSTNIAETSVTVSGVKYVVDSGFVKMRMINPITGIEMLRVLPVSRSQGEQRAGRAGRESSGKCFRLFTEDAFDALSANTLPEIQRTDVSQILLQLKVMGIASPAQFPFISPPSEVALRNGLRLLLILGALNKSDGSLTDHGKAMATLPLSPLFSHLLLTAKDHGCVTEMLTAVSMLSSDTVFAQPHRSADKQAAAQAHRNFASKDGDLVTLLNIFDAWIKTGRDKKWAIRNYFVQRSLVHAFSIRSQLSGLLSKLNIDISLACYPEREPFLRCLLTGLPLNVAQRVKLKASTPQASREHLANVKSVNGKVVTFTLSRASHSNSQRILEGSDIDGAPYCTMRGHQGVHIHPSSVLFSMVNGRKLPEFVVFAELLTTSKQYMRNISVVDSTWLTEMCPHLFINNREAPATSSSSK